jgi:hypothetical protein
MKRISLLFCLMVLASQAMAQDEFDNLISLSWDSNTPLSNKDFVGSTSYRGLRVGYRKRINDHFFVGLDFNNATYNDYKPRQTYYTDAGAYTTDFFRYIYSYGVTVSGDYYFNTEKKLVPFAGLGVGALFNNYKEFYNIYAISDSNWGLLFRPELGVLYKLTRDGKMGVTGAVHFDISTSKSSEFNYANFNTAGFRLGIFIALVE